MSEPLNGRQYQDLIEEAERRGAACERAAIVAHIKENWMLNSKDMIASIEQGAHLKASGGAE